MVRPAPEDGGGLARRLLPGWGRIVDEVNERSARLPTRLNEYGFDPFGFEPASMRSLLAPMVLAYRYYFRAETSGIENVPEGRVLVIGNHAGNTFAWDGALAAMSLFLDGEPPRLVRGISSSRYQRAGRR